MMRVLDSDVWPFAEPDDASSGPSARPNRCVIVGFAHCRHRDLDYTDKDWCWEKLRLEEEEEMGWLLKLHVRTSIGEWARRGTPGYDSSLPPRRSVYVRLNEN